MQYTWLSRPSWEKGLFFFDIAPTARYNLCETGNDARNTFVFCLSLRVTRCAPTGVFIFEWEVSECQKRNDKK